MTRSTLSGGLSPWRIAAIGAVAVLAVAAGAVAGAFVVNGQRGGLGAATSYVPAGAPFYVELRLIPSDAQDAALRQLLGHFPSTGLVDLDRPLVDQLVEHVDDALAGEDVTLTWDTDIAPWFDGHLAMAVLDIDASVVATMDAPPMVVLLGVTDQAAADGALDRLLAALDAPPTTETDHAGTTIHVAEDAGAYALTRDQLVIGTDADAVAAALDAGSGSSASLATSTDVARLSAALPSDWLAYVAYDLEDIVVDAFAVGGDDAMSDAMSDLVAQQPLSGAMTISAAGDRLVLDAVTDAPTGPFAVANAERGLASEVPGDVVYYAEASNVGRALTAVIGSMKAAMIEIPQAADEIARAEAAMGADLEELVSWIGDAGFAAGLDAGTPYAGAVIAPADRDAAERRLDQIAVFASLGAEDSASGISVTEQDLDGVTVTTLCWNDPGIVGEDGPLSSEACVEWALTDDRVLIGSDGFVARMLAVDPATSLGAQQRFSEAVSAMGGPVNAGMVWVDLDRLVTSIGDLGQEAGDVELFTFMLDRVMAWMEPLDAIVSVSRVDGDLLVQRGALIVD